MRQSLVGHGDRFSWAGVVGGFTAFPGAAVVVWTGLRGLPKAQHRAIVQPYIILSQIYSLALVALLHPTYLNARFWLLLALSLPVVVPGTLTGVGHLSTNFRHQFQTHLVRVARDLWDFTVGQDMRSVDSGAVLMGSTANS